MTNKYVFSLSHLFLIQQQQQYIITLDDEEVRVSQLRLSQLYDGPYDICGLLLFLISQPCCKRL